MTPTERDPVKEAYIQKTIAETNRQSVSPAYIITGGLMILALVFVSIKLGQTDRVKSSVLQAGSPVEIQQQNAAIAQVRELVGWYDTDEWETMPSPTGIGTVVIMSRDFAWYVDTDRSIYNVNGLAATITPDLEYAKDLTADAVFAARNR